MLQTILHYIPYVLLFAVAMAFIYGWGLWRTARQKQDLANLLSSKGIARIRKALRKNGAMTEEELKSVVAGLTAKQPFSKETIGVTDPEKFLRSLLPYMKRQKMITEETEKGRTVYRLRR